MKLFRLVDDADHSWHGTRTLAQAKGKESAPALRPMLRLQECDVKTDKDGVTKALNGEPIVQVIRSWSMTNRGGLTSLK